MIKFRRGAEDESPVHSEQCPRARQLGKSAPGRVIE